MCEEIFWYVGYRCGISCVPWGWIVDIRVPRWHPIRSTGFGDWDVLLIRGEWVMSKSSEASRTTAIDVLLDVAEELRVMQGEWDRLSPYEREYLVW